MSFFSTPVAGIRPEAELLICAARVQADSKRAERIRELLQRRMDWGYLVQVARLHGLMSLLYWHLQTICPDAVPTPVMDVLREHFAQNRRRNLFLTGELLNLLQLFAAHAILAIPYKGPTLAAMAYGNLALREFSDLDILVRKQDLPTAKRLLMARGYQPQIRLSAAQEAAFVQSENVLLLVSEERRSVVELHWQLTPRYLAFRADPEQLRHYLEPTFPGGKEIHTLCAEDLLLFLCVHGAKHQWECLGWIGDVANMIERRQGMDWHRIMRQAAALGCERMLYLGLLLAGDLLGSPLPAPVLPRVQADLVAKALALQICVRYSRKPHEPPGLTQRFLFHLRSRERVQDRLSYCVHLVMTPNVGDWEFLPLPAWLSGLYHLLRPIRLLRASGRAALGRRSFLNHPEGYR